MTGSPCCRAGIFTRSTGRARWRCRSLGVEMDLPASAWRSRRVGAGKSTLLHLLEPDEPRRRDSVSARPAHAERGRRGATRNAHWFVISSPSAHEFTAPKLRRCRSYPASRKRSDEHARDPWQGRLQPAQPRKGSSPAASSARRAAVRGDEPVCVIGRAAGNLDRNTPNPYRAHVDLNGCSVRAVSSSRPT